MGGGNNHVILAIPEHEDVINVMPRRFLLPTSVLTSVSLSAAT
jgi:hypothetical protein